MMHEDDQVQSGHLDRRHLMVLGVGAFTALAAPKIFRTHRRVVRRNVPVMGTLAEVVVVHADIAHAHAAIDAAVKELRYVERTMSRFDPLSDIGRANAAAGGEAVAITSHTAVVLEEALRWAVASDGRFEPCYGKAIELWDVTNRTAPPPREKIRELTGRRLFDSLDLASLRGRPMVKIGERDAAIDLGGIAKGYGVDRSVTALRDFGIEDGLVNVGGDLYALGLSEEGDPWRIGVRSPDDPSTSAGMFELTDMAAATSGDYLRYFTHCGTRYHHILNPQTGEPFGGRMHSVTVTASNCMRADAATTSVFGLEPSEVANCLKRWAPDARMIDAA